LPDVHAFASGASVGLALALFEKTNDAVFLENENDDIVAVNPRASELFGYSRDELQRMKVPDLQAPEVRGCLGTVIKGELKRHQGNPFEGLDLHRDGQRFPVEITNTVIEDNGTKLVLSIVRDITERNRAEETNRQLQDRLQAEHACLHNAMQLDSVYPKVIGRSDSLGRALMQVKQVSATDATVLLLGETGTGKELLAAAIHDLSPRRDRPMIKVNCAALPATLMESELFGREKGAYTGALSKQVGRFELADGSTIFLDEVGELPVETQGKLLRVIQDGCFERLGSPTTVRVQVRMIAATSRDLARMVADGCFRKDLYYRLNVFPIEIPPLRERRDDIPLLVWSFVEELGRRMGRSVEAVSPQSLHALQHYPWPGNIRELRNVVERALITCHGPTLFIEPPAHPGSPATGLTLEEVERAHILRVLEMTGWRVRGKQGAANILGVPPTTLDSRMVKLDIHRPSRCSASP
jgi:PAS domain S-box-containing protein